jgi:hypothetical protein
MKRSHRIIRATFIGSLAVATMFVAARADAATGLPTEGTPPLAVPAMPDGPLPIDALPAGTDPSPSAPIPAPADLGQVPTQPSPAGPGLDGAGAAPALPGGTDQNAGGTPDLCASITKPLADGGAPIAARCPVRQTSEGGVDVPVCIDIGVIASCDDETASTPTTAPTGTTDPPSHSTTPTTTRASSSRPAGTTLVEAEHTSSGPGSGSTLPFTGAAVAMIAAIGALCLGSGGALQRFARSIAAKA